MGRYIKLVLHDFEHSKATSLDLIIWNLACCPNNLRFSIGSVCHKYKNVLRFHKRLKASKTNDEDLSIRILEEYEILGKSLNWVETDPSA